MTPTAWKGSNGRVEQASKAVEGRTRTIFSCVATRYDVEVPTGHPVVQWAIRHAAWLWERFEQGEDGLGCGHYHNTQCKRRIVDRAASASHVGAIQTASQAARSAASSSQVGGASQDVSDRNVATSQVGGARSNQVEDRAGVQAGPRAVHVGAANQETQLRAFLVGAANQETR